RFGDDWSGNHHQIERPARTRCVTFRSAMNDTNGTHPASNTSRMPLIDPRALMARPTASAMQIMYGAPGIGDHTCDGVGVPPPYRMTITVTRMSRPMPGAIAATRKRLSAASTFGLTDSSAVVSADAGVWDEVMPSLLACLLISRV